MDGRRMVESLPTLALTEVFCVEKLGHMAGNAFSQYHVLPWTIATLAVLGRFGKESFAHVAEASADAGADESNSAKTISDGEPVSESE